MTSEYLETALGSLNRARALTMQLLTFAKGGAPIQRIEPLSPLIRETVGFALSGSSVSCAFAMADDLWPCNIDRNQIGQVIDNIVINAQQAMPAGGNIEIAASNVPVGEGEHALLVAGDYVRVSIKDSGVGIPKGVLPYVFDPFYTTKTDGHGLGLTVCHSIVRRHGGCIDVESEPGKGSTFRVYLPASRNPPEVAAATTARHPGAGTVIAVDDQEVVRNTVREMLESLGYAVVCLSDGKAALEFYKRECMAGQRFAAILLDLTMPGGMGGRELLAEIRKVSQAIPVFAMSGYANDGVMTAPAEHGFSGSIAKPFRLAELSAMLSKG
jgi:CheY-like chemotaxis protein